MNAWKITVCICTIAAAVTAGCHQRSYVAHGRPGGCDWSAGSHCDLGEPVAHVREHRAPRHRSRRPRPERDGFRNEIPSGTLTAGQLDDSRNLESYRQFVEDHVTRTPLASIARRCWDPPVVLTVVDEEGFPLGNAEVTVRAGWLQRTLQLRTRTDGRVVILPQWDGLGRSGSANVDIRTPNNQGSIRIEGLDLNRTHHTFSLWNTHARLPGALDLAFVVDSTGSMSDELEFLKVEIRSIAAEISRRYPNVHQRYALIVYRDHGDDYVTRVYNFTDSLETFQHRLGQQSADGGGDYPEAVDEALQRTGELDWRGGNVARVVFHVADAPPHNDHAERALKAMDPLRAKGVAVYPLAGSGAARLAEFTMRTEAMLTGSSYLFLTDDSGVGNPHAEPHAARYNVEALKGLMIRMVAGELDGGPKGPHHRDVIRTVTLGDRQ